MSTGIRTVRMRSAAAATASRMSRIRMAKVGHKKGDKGSGVYLFSKRPRDSISVRDYTPRGKVPDMTYDLREARVRWRR